MPRYAGVQTVIGKARLDLDDPAGARRAFEEALAKDPDDADARAGLAACERKPRIKGARTRPSLASRRPSDRTASFEPGSAQR